VQPAGRPIGPAVGGDDEVPFTVARVDQRVRPGHAAAPPGRAQQQRRHAEHPVADATVRALVKRGVEAERAAIEMIGDPHPAHHRLSICGPPVRLIGDHSEKEEAMKYMLLIHQGTTPTPGSDEWESLSEDEQKAVYADYKAINETPGVSPSGIQMQPPETATTVRVQDGKTLTTDGPFVEIKEALGGYLLFEADDLDAAIELASRIPAARMGGAIEVRPLVER